jgi:hypothetical protein
LKNTQALNFMEVHPLGAMLFHADGQTDMVKLIDASRSFVRMPTNRGYVHVQTLQCESANRREL